MKSPHQCVWRKAPTRVALALGVLGCQLPIASADVIINEISAASSEKLLRILPDGRPRVGWGPGWMDPDFDDAAWDSGTAPFGFGNDDIETDVGEAMRGQTPSLYLRKTFTVSAEDAATEEVFRLSAEADSGFVAYINGHEIARANLGRRNGYVYHDQSAFSSAQQNERITYNAVVLASDVLVEGENVFAVQVQNTVPSQINERDRSTDNSLRFAVGSLSIGLGIFQGGSNIPIELTDDDWKYQIGHAEPSGGFADLRQAALPDREGEFSDWIELHNSGDEDVDLTGWHLTDDPDLSDKWTFPETTTIPAGGFLVVLADEVTDVAGEYLHVAFRLSGDGEFLGLYDPEGNLVSGFEDGYPEQGPFHSYGVSAADAAFHAYFSEPSPGKPNGGPELTGFVKKPDFEPKGGVYDEAVELTLTTSTEDAVIRYTTDGSEPSEVNGTVYEGPITIEPIDEKTGTPVRARAFKEDLISSRIETQTYLVGVDDVFKEIPTVSVVAEAGYAFYKPHGIMSVEGGTGIGEDWRAQTVDDYYMPDMHGRPFERQMSMEIIYPDDGVNVQIDGGIRLAASAWSRGRFALRNTDRSPWDHTPAEKPSFNIFFRNDYGKEALDDPIVENYPVRSFEQLRMRAGKNDIRNPWITDELSRRLMMDTGQFSSVGIQNALFVNGVYKGYFNTVSRLREELFQEYHGSDAPWQVKHIDVWADGGDESDLLADPPEFKHLEALLDEDLTKLENYEAVLEVLDPVNFADYFIVNIYGATWDWPHNNLVIAREMSDEGRWRAYMWDAEGMFGVQGGHGLTYNSITTDLKNRSGTTPSDDLATIWNGLMVSPEFRLLFADRLQKHFFTPGGALTKQNMLRRLEELKAEIGPLMQFSGGGSISTSGIENWINSREDVLFKSAKQFENEGLWGGILVPYFKPEGGQLDEGATVKIDVGSLFQPQSGDIYITTDGSDPRLPGGMVNPEATLYDRDGPGLVIDETTTLKSRVRVTSIFDPIGKWSALAETTYRVGITLASGDNLVISEIMADPAAPNDSERSEGFDAADFEFLEFHNPTDTAVDLADLHFASGIDYVFANGDRTSLPAGTYAVIVSNREAFTMRYGDGVPILGVYGRKLNNGGETLEIANGAYESIRILTFGGDEPWPTNPSDGGFSLVLKEPSANPDANDPSNWVLGSVAGGTPGRAEDGTVIPVDPAYDTWKALHFAGAELTDAQVSGFFADPDGDGDNNLTEFAFGALPKDGQSRVVLHTALQSMDLNGESIPHLTLNYLRRTPPGDLDYTLERSEDLREWEPVPPVELVEVDSEPAGEGLTRVTLSVTPVVQKTMGFIRWRVTMED